MWGAWCESEGCGVLGVSQVVDCSTPHTASGRSEGGSLGGGGGGREVNA